MESPLQSIVKASLDVDNNPKLLWGYLLTIVTTYWVYSFLRDFRQSSSFPIINHDKGAWTYYSAKESFLKNARQLLAEGSRKFSGPFNLITESGPVIILPPEAIDSINAEKNLSFVEYVREEFLSDFDTFRTMRPWPAGMFNEAILKGITRPLPRFTKPMSLEIAACLNESWGDQKEWHEVRLIEDAQGWVARMSNMVFLGEEFAHNKEWVRITTSYTMSMFMAIRATKSFHPLLRPLIDRFSPLNRKVRRDQATIAAIIRPVLKARHEEITAAKREGRKPNLPDDSIEWFRHSAAGRSYPEVWIQLGLAQVAIQTTSNQLCQTILYLCAYPQYVEPLRKEAIEVLKKYGLQRPALNEMYFLDSFLKETQRLRPDSMASMHRRAMEDVQLSGGIKIQKGEHLAISSHPMWDEENYPSPDRFDPYRFIERRKIPGYETKSSFISTSPDHLGFAHGKLACPGRFLASSILKIAMLHLLFKYDMKIADPADANPWSHGTDVLVNTNAKVWMKARKPEVDLEVLAQSL